MELYVIHGLRTVGIFIISVILGELVTIIKKLIFNFIEPSNKTPDFTPKQSI